jgi:lysophospholipase L1-like esterase
VDRFQVTPGLVSFEVDSGKSVTVTNIGSATVYGSPDAMFPNVAAAAWTLAPGASRVEDQGPVWVRTADGTSSVLTLEFIASGTVIDVGSGLPSSGVSATALAAAAKRAGSLFRGQPVVATRGNGAIAFGATTGTTASGSSSDGTAQKMMVRQVLTATSDAIDLRLVLGNYAAYFAGLNDITVTAGVEVGGSVPFTSQFSAPNTGADVFGVTFGGKAAVVIPGGASSKHVVSDPVPLRITKGQRFAVRLFVTVANAGEKIPLARQAAGFGVGDGVYYNDLAVDLTQAVTNFGTPGVLACYAPVCILGTPLDGVFPIVVVAEGDSITQGTSDLNQENYGWVERWLAGAGVAVINSGRGGGTAADIVTSLPRQQQFPLISGCSSMVCAYGRNDVSGGTALATIQANLIKTWKYAADLGINVKQTTITPRSQSTDVFITVANQSPNALSHDEIRIPLNAWIRDGAPMLAGVAVATGSSAGGTLRSGATGHPLTGYIEIADPVETARDSGKWKTGAEGTCTTTSGSPTLTVVTASSGTWQVGQKIVGTGIPGSTYVGSVGAGTIGLVNSLGSAANATATATGIVIGAPFTDDGVHPNRWGHDRITASLPAATILT